MKIKSANNIIRRIFFHSHKYLMLVFSVCFLCANIFSAYVVANETDRQNEISKAKLLYGAYDYALFAAEEEQLKQIKGRTDIEYYRTVALQGGKVNEREVLMEFIHEEDLYYTDIKLNAGSFPENSSEVAVEKWFMIQLGIHSDEIIGTELKVWNEEKRIYENKVITGIISTYYADEQLMQGIPVILCNQAACAQELNGSNIFYNIYISLRNHRDALQETEQWVEDDFVCNLNGELYYAFGYSEIALYLQVTKEILFLIVMILLFLFVGISLNNTVNICISKWVENIAILKILGVSMKTVVRNITAVFLATVLSAGTLGSACGILLAHVIHTKSMKWLLHERGTDLVIPYAVEGIMLLFLGIVSVAVLMNKFSRIKQENAYETIRFLNHSPLETKKDLPNLFTNKTAAIFKLAFRNISFHKGQKIILMLCISMSISIICILSVQMRTVQKVQDNNDHYDYKLEMYTGAEVYENVVEAHMKSIYDEIRKLCEKYQVIPYLSDFAILEIRLDKKYLTEDYKKKLNMDVVSMQELRSNRSYVNQELLLMPCSEQMLQQLNQEGKCTLLRLEDDQGIFVERSINQNYTFSGRLIPPIGETYELRTYRTNKKGWFQTLFMEVVASASDIDVYPEYEGNYLVALVNENTFHKYYNEAQIYDCYFHTEDQEFVHALEDEIAGTNYFTLRDLNQELKDVRSSRRQTLLMYYLIFLTSVICIFFNINILHSFELDVRKHEYAFMKLLGISGRVQKILAGMECGVIFIAGSVLGGICTKVVVELLYQNLIIENDKVPAGILWLCTFVISLCFITSLLLLWNKLKRIRMREEIRG